MGVISPPPIRHMGVISPPVAGSRGRDFPSSGGGGFPSTLVVISPPGFCFGSWFPGLVSAGTA